MWASQLTSPSIPEDDTCSGGYADRIEMFNQIREILPDKYERIVLCAGISKAILLASVASSALRRSFFLVGVTLS